MNRLAYFKLVKYTVLNMIKNGELDGKQFKNGDISVELTTFDGKVVIVNYNDYKTACLEVYHSDNRRMSDYDDIFNGKVKDGD